MTFSPEVIRTSYVACRRLARRAGSNFYPCFLLLERSKRRAMDALYAFMRHTDDLGDNPEPARVRHDALVHWRALVEQALLDQLPPLATREPQHEELEEPEDFVGHALLPAVADTVRRFQIPHEHLHAVIDGVEMDLARQRYETFEDLCVYCRRVASAVGLACIRIWGFRGEDAPDQARKCGIALQLTNILRDLREDAEVGRIYLPQADLRQCEYPAEYLRRGVVNERFHRLVALEIDRAKQLYHEGADLIDSLEPDGRRIFGMIFTTYYRILHEIEQHVDQLLIRRIRLGRWQKLRIALRWILLPPRRTALP